MKKTIFLLALTFCVLILQAQQHAYHWYFGDEAGLDFSSGSAVAVTDGALTTYDNCSSISDDSGDLLFYSNGITVWNRSHAVMMNGTGLLGHLTSQHSSTAFQVAHGEQSSYYIFTVDAFSGSNGLHYNTVNMSLDGGMGAVELKNVPVASDMTEKVVAVRHSNGNDVWVITHKIGTNEFYTWLVSGAGVSSTPVISAAGSVHPVGSPYGYGGLGQISASPDGSMIAMGLYYNSEYELLEFDNSTGILSNPITLTGYSNAWGVEFSPDGNKLYATGWKTDYVYQFDLSVYSASAISASAVFLGSVTSPDFTYKSGSLQLGPDGKVYISKYGSGYLAVVNAPNASGAACNLVDNGLYLNTRQSYAGFPTYIKDDLLLSASLPNQASEVKIYPNPASDHFYIHHPDFGKGISVDVFQSDGKLILSKFVDAFETDIDCGDWSKGIYLLSFYKDGVFQQTEKLIVP